MDPISLALITAIVAGLGKGVHNVAERTVIQSYEALKGMIAKKLGRQSEVMKSIEILEQRPESAARQQLLQEEIASSRAVEMPEILEAARELIAHFEESHESSVVAQQAIGSYIAQANQSARAEIKITNQAGGKSG